MRGTFVFGGSIVVGRAGCAEAPERRYLDDRGSGFACSRAAPRSVEMVRGATAQALVFARASSCVPGYAAGDTEVRATFRLPGDGP